jgi:hypothetical protein
MQPTEATKTNPAAGAAPTPRPSMAWRVMTVEPLPELRLRVVFFDGIAGEVRLRSFLESPQVSGTIFEPLREPGIFRQVHVELGAVTWPNGADLAPDAMYDAIRERGHWEVGG